LGLVELQGSANCFTSNAGVSRDGGLRNTCGQIAATVRIADPLKPREMVLKALVLHQSRVVLHLKVVQRYSATSVLRKQHHIGAARTEEQRETSSEAQVFNGQVTLHRYRRRQIKY
jgi:hypothetical protein